MTPLDQPAPDRPPGDPGPADGPPGGDPVARDRERLLRRSRRPTPSRRLRRLHPRQAGLREEPAAETEAGPQLSGGTDRVPLGVLIAGSPVAADPGGGHRTRRVAAQLVRLGAGTSLVVLPAWREAIAVAVSTEHLLASTGLGMSELPNARLTVLINPEALHDRDLGLRDWCAGGTSAP
jgi:hypothetical protein